VLGEEEIGCVHFNQILHRAEIDDPEKNLSGDLVAAFERICSTWDGSELRGSGNVRHGDSCTG